MNRSDLLVTAGPLVAGGDSLVRQEGQKVLFVEGALPGEEVEVEIIEDLRDLTKAKVTKVLTASPDRVEPTCAMFGEGCGGCPWHYIDPIAQQRYKTEIVRDAMTRIAKRPEIDLQFVGGVGADGYRTSMRLGVTDGKAGLRRRHSHDVLTGNACTIVHPLLRPMITDRTWGTLEEVTLRASVTTGDTMFVPGANAKETLLETVGGRDFRISPKSFFQSGLEAAVLLSETVDAFMPDDIGWLVDTYAGVGLLGSIVAAKRGARLTAVEQSHDAVVDARYNLADLEAEVIQAEVATIELTDAERPDVIIADPSRTGLGKSASATLSGLGAELIVLVSCDPASLARDTVLLGQQGYELGPIRVLDLFPHTPHVETVSIYRRTA